MKVTSSGAILLGVVFVAPQALKLPNNFTLVYFTSKGFVFHFQPVASAPVEVQREQVVEV